MKKVVLFLALGSALISAKSEAYPLLSSYAESVNGRVIFFRDHNFEDKYWYFSTVIDPVENLDGSISTPVVRSNYLYFAYSGQAQVRKSDLEAFAALKGISTTDIAPVPFEKTELTGCHNVDAAKISIQIPPRVGSFLEHLPVTVSTRDPESIDVLSEALRNGSGVNCFANVLYKVAADEHSIHYEVQLDDIFTQFQAASHTRFWFWETDIRTNLKDYAKRGWIRITEFKDGDMNQPKTLDPNDTSKSTEEMFMTVFDLIIKQLFTRVTKIPEDAALPGHGNGVVFSLNANYSRSTEQFSFRGDFALRGTRLQESLIQIRVAPKQ